MDKLLTIEQVSEILGYHPVIVRKLIYEGELPGIKLKRFGSLSHPRVRSSDLENWIQSNSIPAMVQKKGDKYIENFKKNKTKEANDEIRQCG